VGATDDLIASFLVAATVPLDRSHVSGTLDEARSLLAAHPDLPRASIYTASVLGDDAHVRDCIDADPGSATAKGGPHQWDALTHLCFSRFLQHDRERSDGFVKAARLLLDAGASANTGWWERNHQPAPEWESVLYGAAGIAKNAALTRLLIERGAEPNDVEAVYHSPETYDNSALAVIVETGRLTPSNLSMMLIRKHDWHDFDGVKYLLDHGSDPNYPWRPGFRAITHAVRRDNHLEIVKLLLDRSGDPTLDEPGQSAMSIAGRRGRGDLLRLFSERGIPNRLTGVDRLIASCALADASAVRAIAAREPGLVRELVAMGGALLPAFSGNGNTVGVQRLLDLGVPIDARWAEGDAYFGVARDSTALHVASWRAQHDTVAALIAHGAEVNARNGRGETPLMLAVRAAVDSYWTSRRSPASVAALLAAGASTEGVNAPCGYDAIDALLRQHSVDPPAPPS